MIWKLASQAQRLEGADLPSTAAKNAPGAVAADTQSSLERYFEDWSAGVAHQGQGMVVCESVDSQYKQIHFSVHLVIYIFTFLSKLQFSNSPPRFDCESPVFTTWLANFCDWTFQNMSGDNFNTREI